MCGSCHWLQIQAVAPLHSLRTCSELSATLSQVAAWLEPARQSLVSWICCCHPLRLTLTTAHKVAG